jgi:hypothetical protein
MLTKSVHIRTWIVIALFVAAGLPAWGLGRTTARAAEPKAATVRLVVDYGDGVETHFKALPWREGMTVLDALDAAGKHPHGVAYKKRGAGGGALITQIGDVANEGGGRENKNWLFYVNDKQATASAGKTTLAAGDVALWRFQVYEYNP